MINIMQEDEKTNEEYICCLGKDTIQGKTMADSVPTPVKVRVIA